MEYLTLVLTPWMSAHKVIKWQDAITDSYLSKVEVLAEYDEIVSSPSVTMNIPAVVRLKRYINSHKRGVKFSRINVFTRDGFRCQYCGVAKTMRELNYDHVTPRKLGGKTNWENIVTSCYPCNTRKDHKTLAQAGMRLLKAPFRPKTLPMTAPIVNMRSIPEEWKFYLTDESAIILSHTG